MGGVYIEKYFSQSLYCLAYNLIASHTNSHSNTNTGLIANNNISNAIRGLMNNIIINNNNNNIIILFSHYLIEQQGIEPYTTLVHHITLTAVLYSCAKLSTSSMDYTPLIRIAGLEPTLHVPKTRMLPLTLYPVTICHKNYNL